MALWLRWRVTGILAAAMTWLVRHHHDRLAYRLCRTRALQWLERAAGIW